MTKINFIIHFSLEILHFKRILQFNWPTAFRPINQEPEFCKVCDWWWNISNNISFDFRLFPGKIKKKLKKSKKPYFGANLGNFWPNLRKNKLSWKKGLCQFLNNSIIYHGANNLKKVTTHSLQKCQTADGQTEQWFYRTLQRTGVQNIKFGTLWNPLWEGK